MLRILAAAGVAGVVSFAGFANGVLTATFDHSPRVTATAAVAATRPTSRPKSAKRVYGAPVKVGNGRVRSYVLFDARDRNAPREIGVAFDEAALEGLPSSGAGHHDGHMETHEYIVSLPDRHGTPFTFLEMNWNPAGHEPEGVYLNVPHFDFHFYTITKAERDAIMPSDSAFASKANNVPTGDYVPPMMAALGPPGAPPAAVAVPMMGVHWVDLRSHELQGLLGKPEAFKPFDATYIYGSWNGKFIFQEPMITRAHILGKKTAASAAERDQRIAIPVAAKYAAPGYYPTAYRITWDAEAKEYRVALTDLVRRD